MRSSGGPKPSNFSTLNPQWAGAWLICAGIGIMPFDIRHNTYQVRVDPLGPKSLPEPEPT
jgi:hypothetical protein